MRIFLSFAFLYLKQKQTETNPKTLRFYVTRAPTNRRLPSWRSTAQPWRHRLGETLHQTMEWLVLVLRLSARFVVSLRAPVCTLAVVLCCCHVCKISGGHGLFYRYIFVSVVGDFTSRDVNNILLFQHSVDYTFCFTVIFHCSGHAFRTGERVKWFVFCFRSGGYFFYKFLSMTNHNTLCYTYNTVVVIIIVIITENNYVGGVKPHSFKLQQANRFKRVYFAAGHFDQLTDRLTDKQVHPHRLSSIGGWTIS